MSHASHGYADCESRRHLLLFNFRERHPIQWRRNVIVQFNSANLSRLIQFDRFRKPIRILRPNF